MHVHAHEPEDFVVSLLATLRRLGVNKFKADPVKLHTCFYAWRNRAELAVLLGAFTFDTRDYFPVSDTLDDALDALQFSGYLERTNPRGTYYLLLDTLPSMFDEAVRDKFTEDELQMIRELAEQFSREFPVVRSTA